MLTSQKPNPVVSATILLALFSLGLPDWAVAAPHETALEVSGGKIAFTETTETFAGGTARFYVTPRVSLGPEISFIQGDNHTHWMATGNLTLDFLTQRSERHFIPFAVVGGGLFETREKFNNQTLTSREGAFTAGTGIRLLLGDHVTLGADIRIGWELHVRVGGSLGVRLGN